jgi:hypothetical protein
MCDCRPAVLTCLVADGLQASSGFLLADIAFVSRRFGIDTATLAGLGRAVAVLLRLRIERSRRPRWPADSPPSHPCAAGRQREGGDRSGGG